MKELKEYLKIFLMIIISIIIFVFILIFIVMAFMKVNDYSAYRVLTELKGVPLPEKTVMVDSTYAAGKMIGNGNGMQFLGDVLIKSELSYEELKDYYNNYSDTELTVFEKDNITYYFHRKHYELTFKNYPNNSNYYVVYKWGKGMAFFEFFDIRGYVR